MPDEAGRSLVSSRPAAYNRWWMGPRGEYGYDAPYVLAIFAVLSILTAIGLTISLWRETIPAAIPIAIYFFFFLANTGSFLYTTRRGKFLEWNRILDLLRLRGDERVLDM